MSIEQSLESIAISLETIAANFRAPATPVEIPPQAPEVSAPASVRTTRGRPKQTAPTAAPVVAAASELEAPENPFSAEPEVTVETLTDTLRRHGAAFGVQVTLSLMKTHGADAVNPKIVTIPKANYAALVEAAEAEIAKAKKGK